jgi:hypothetical protein
MKGALPLLFLSLPLVAAFEEKPFSARTSALGGAVTAAAPEASSGLSNPASLRFLPRPEAQAAHTRLFGDEGLSVNSLSVAFPTRRFGSWGMVMTDFGNDLYREREGILSQSFLAAPRLALGCSVGLATVRMSRYGSLSAWGVDAGLLARVSPSIDFGWTARRLNRPRFSGAREGPPAESRFGAAMKVFRSMTLTLDAVRTPSGHLTYRSGQEWSLSSRLDIRAGVESRPARYAMGFGFQGWGGRMDYAFSSHPFLGDQHQAALSFPWGR